MSAHKPSGIVRIAKALKYSMAGAVRLWREPAFRQEVIAAVFLLAAMAAVSSPAFHFVVMAALIMIVFAAEAMNTAIEEIVDAVSPDFSEMARNAKDLGSLAVALSLLAAGCFGVYSIVTELLGFLW